MPCSPLKVNGFCGRNMAPPSSTSKNKHESSMKSGGFLLGLFFDPEDGGGMFLRNVGWLSTDYTALCPRGRTFHNDRCENLNHIRTLVSNPTHGKNICSHYLCFYCRVQVEGLRWADHHAISPTNFWYDSEFQKLIMNWNRSECLIHGGLRSIILDTNSIANSGLGGVVHDAFPR
jgi:hypothetical protein